MILSLRNRAVTSDSSNSLISLSGFVPESQAERPGCGIADSFATPYTNGVVCQIGPNETDFIVLTYSDCDIGTLCCPIPGPVPVCN